MTCPRRLFKLSTILYVQEAGSIGEYGYLKHCSRLFVHILNLVYSLLGEKVEESVRL